MGTHLNSLDNSCFHEETTHSPPVTTFVVSSSYMFMFLGTLYSKTCVKRSLLKMPKIVFQDYLTLNAGQKYCRMLFIKLPFVIKIFILSIFEWLFYTGFSVLQTVWTPIRLLQREQSDLGSLCLLPS